MDWQVIASAAGGLLLFAYGFIFSRIIGDQRELERSLSDHKSEMQKELQAIPDRYIRRDDMNRRMDEILEAVRDVREDLKRKADKP